jgi:hypothetical protein
MAIPHNSTAFDTHKCTGGYIKYPFRDFGDSATKVYVHQMTGNRSTYAPLSDDDEMTAADEKPTGSPFSDDANAFYVGDSDTQDNSDGTVSYERKFANIPADRTIELSNADPNGLYAFTFPKCSSSTEDLVSTGNETFTYSLASDLVTVSFDLAALDFAKLEIGDLVNIENTTDEFLIENSGGDVFTFSGNSLFPARVTALSSNNVTVEFDLFSSSTTNDTATNNRNSGFTTYTCRLYVFIGRADPQSINAPSLIEYRYVKTNDVSALVNTLDAEFFAIDSLSRRTDSLSSTTIPTNNRYAEMYKNGDYINAEPELVDQWNGNIYEIKTIKVRVS